VEFYLSIKKPNSVRGLYGDQFPKTLYCRNQVEVEDQEISKIKIREPLKDATSSKEIEEVLKFKGIKATLFQGQISNPSCLPLGNLGRFRGSKFKFMMLAFH